MVTGDRFLPLNIIPRLIAGCMGAMLLPFSIFVVALESDAPDVEVLGLFKGAAVLRIDGQRQLLKMGDESPSGLVLISADSKTAVIEYKGQQKTFYLSDKVSSVFEVPENIVVSIQRNNQGQYKTTGSINGVPVSYLVDTGATIMAMSSVDARNLGVDYESGQAAEAVTAGGLVKSWRIVLDRVQVGQILRQNVEAAVLEGDYPVDILLGMTFLHQVSMQEADGVLLLKSRF
jgi:aspartyl protease family protein